MQDECVDQNRHQRPGLLRIPAPIAPPRFVRPNPTEVGPDTEHEQASCEREFTQPSHLTHERFDARVASLGRDGHQRQIDEADDRPKHQKAIGPRLQRHVNGQPVGIQDRNQRRDLWIEVTQQGDEQDDARLNHRRSHRPD